MEIKKVKLQEDVIVNRLEVFTGYEFEGIFRTSAKINHEWGNSFGMHFFVNHSPFCAADNYSPFKHFGISKEVTVKLQVETSRHAFVGDSFFDNIDIEMFEELLCLTSNESIDNIFINSYVIKSGTTIYTLGNQYLYDLNETELITSVELFDYIKEYL